ncbi:MAG: hypothetical protein AUG75_18560 [Cyanobacteria bacterium 13_1_20CM_4_61_6]|nr:MAG: hypothetical protein AUG75_18560 [Cyanobacteria bacterium 13_1_20CM_4_61_6]
MYFGARPRLMQHAVECLPPWLVRLPFLSFAYDCFRPLVDSLFSSGCQAAPELGKKDGCTQEFTRFDKTGLTRLKAVSAASIIRACSELAIRASEQR